MAPCFYAGGYSCSRCHIPDFAKKISNSVDGQKQIKKKLLDVGVAEGMSARFGIKYVLKQ